VRKEEVRKALALRHNAGVYGIGADPKLYDRTHDELTLDEIERIAI
jgi:hypothetical protein